MKIVNWLILNIPSFESCRGGRLSGIEQDLDRTILRLDKLEDIVHQNHGME